MARRHDLPGWFAHVDRHRSLPLRAELTVAAVVIALVLSLDLRGAIAFSSVTVLTYYAVTNASALTLPAEHRRWPRPVAVLGFVGCVVVALALPLDAVVGGAVVLVLGVVIRLISNRLTGR